MADVAGFLEQIRFPKPQFKREAGTPGQLDYGQAGQLNTQAAVTPQAAATPSATAPTSPPNTAGQGVAASPEQPFRPQTPEEKFLFGPTTRPNEPQNTPLNLAPLPAGWETWMPLLAATAADPGAPAEAKALFTQMMDRSRRQGGPTAIP